LIWNTFLGGSGEDRGIGVAVTVNGKVRITGASNATWGNPLRPFSGAYDAFVTTLNITEAGFYTFLSLVGKP
jgi:hypothetical protein